MIGKANYMRQIRPIANNIVDFSRIDPYIEEVETLTIMPEITPILYKILDENPFEDVENGITLSDAYGNQILLSAAEYKTIFMPCYYDGMKSYSQGLIEAISYLAYSRMLKNQSVNVTAFGVKVKNTNFSSDVEEGTIFRMANEAQKIGLVYLNQTIDYLKFLGLLKPCNEKINVHKFKAIGD